MNFSLLFLKGGETVSDIFQRRFAKYGDKNGELFHFQTSMLVSQYPKVLFDSILLFQGPRRPERKKQLLAGSVII